MKFGPLFTFAAPVLLLPVFAMQSGNARAIMHRYGFVPPGKVE